MAKTKEKKLTPEELKDQEGMMRVAQCRRLEQHSKDYRRKFDWEWLVRTLYVRGYHFARYNRGTNSIVFSTRSGVRIPVNLVGAHLRGVRNQVTSFKPKWEVLPKVTTKSAFENARHSGKVLDNVYETAQIKRKIKEVVTDSLMYSIGIWHFDIDRDKNIVISRVDPFDWFVDPNVKSSNINDPEYGAEFVMLHHQMPIDAVKKNPNYKHTEDIATDNLTASAEYKQFLLQVTKNQFHSKREENETIILKEAFIRERQENGKFKIRILTYVDGVDKPLQDELTDDEEYPFEVLQGDIQPGDLYGESWLKHLIPVNRVIDALESHIFEYNHFFAKGRFIIDKNSGVRLIVNQHGQIIEKNRGSQVQPITVPPLPPSPQQQIDNMRRYLEDLSGVHDVSLGRMPGTVRSGIAIAELKQADATNQSDLVDNLEDFLSRAGRKILNLVAENWTTTKLISTTALGGKPEYFMAVGERGTVKNRDKYTFGEMKLPLAIIGRNSEVRVQIGSWLAYTKEARQEKLKELFRLGAIDQKTYLEYSEFSDIDGIIERTRNEQVLQMRAGKPSESVQSQFGIEMDEQSLAMAENELMLEGVDQPVDPNDDHEVHLAVHKPEIEDEIVRAHINEHIKWQQWQTKAQSQPIPPEQIQAQGPPTPNGQGGVPPIDPAMMGMLGGGGQ